VASSLEVKGQAGQLSQSYAQSVFLLWRGGGRQEAGRERGREETAAEANKWEQNFYESAAESPLLVLGRGEGWVYRSGITGGVVKRSRLHHKQLFVVVVVLRRGAVV
jgi:hypothetical protein